MLDKKLTVSGPDCPGFWFIEKGYKVNVWIEPPSTIYWVLESIEILLFALIVENDGESINEKILKL